MTDIRERIKPTPLCGWRGCPDVSSNAIASETGTGDKPWEVRFFCDKHADRFVDRLRGGE